MGDPYKKQQVKNAKKRWEEARREASEPRLPTRGALQETKVALIPAEGNEYVCGEKLIVMADDNSLKVIRDGYLNVGHVEGEIAAQLRAVFAADGGTNVLEVLVTEVASISGVVYAQAVHR